MRIVRTMCGLFAASIALLCTATVTAQLVGAGVLWTRGMLGAGKLVRYAGVLYGLDPARLLPPQDDAAAAAPQGKAEILAARAQESATLQERVSAIGQGTHDIRVAALALKMKRDRHEGARKSFESYLQQLQTEVEAAGLRELYLTLEALPPRQTKDILTTMLDEAPSDPLVMSHVVAVLQMMPEDKLSKTIGEFKRSDEQALLHEILVQIGKLYDARATLDGGQP